MNNDTKNNATFSNDVKYSGSITLDSKNYFDYWGLTDVLDTLSLTLDQYTLADGNYGNITNDTKYGNT
jgi:hypothetical protein